MQCVRIQLRAIMCCACVVCVCTVCVCVCVFYVCVCMCVCVCVRTHALNILAPASDLGSASGNSNNGGALLLGVADLNTSSAIHTQALKDVQYMGSVRSLFSLSSFCFDHICSCSNRIESRILSVGSGSNNDLRTCRHARLNPYHPPRRLQYPQPRRQRRRGGRPGQ